MMRLKLEASTDVRVGDFKRLLRLVNINKIVLRSQRELVVFLGKLEDRIKHWILKRQSSRHKMPSNPTWVTLFGDSVEESFGGVKEQEDDEYFGAALIAEIDEFDKLMAANVALMKNLLVNDQLIGIGYAFLVMKEKAKLMEIEKEIKEKEQEERKYQKIVNNRLRVLRVNNEIENIPIDDDNMQDEIIISVKSKESLEAMRVRETIFLSECVRKQQIKELAISETLKEKLDEDISDRKFTIEYLLPNGNNRTANLPDLIPELKRTEPTERSNADSLLAKTLIAYNGTEVHSFETLCREYTKFGDPRLASKYNNNDEELKRELLFATPMLSLQENRPICTAMTPYYSGGSDVPRMLVRFRRSRRQSTIDDTIYRTNAVAV